MNYGNTRKMEKGQQFDGWEGRKLDVPYYVRNQHLGYHAGLYHQNYFDQDQLYNLKNDPLEKNNLYTFDSEKIAEMKAILAKDLRSFSQRPFGEFTR